MGLKVTKKEMRTRIITYFFNMVIEDCHVKCKLCKKIAFNYIIVLFIPLNFVYDQEKVNNRTITN